jgi:regulator of chromosome condensation
VARNGKVYSWGFSDGYRTGLGTEDSVKTPTLLHSNDLAEGRIIFAGCGGQFSVIAGLAGQN